MLKKKKGHTESLFWHIVKSPDSPRVGKNDLDTWSFVCFQHKTWAGERCRVMFCLYPRLTPLTSAAQSQRRECSWAQFMSFHSPRDSHTVMTLCKSNLIKRLYLIWFCSYFTLTPPAHWHRHCMHLAHFPPVHMYKHTVYVYACKQLCMLFSVIF